MPDSVRRSPVAATQRIVRRGRGSAAGRAGGLRLTRLDERVDREELRLRPEALSEPQLLRGRHDPPLGEPLEVVLRLPDVVDVPALVPLSRGVDDQTVWRFALRHRVAPEHLLAQLPVRLLGYA